MERQVRRYAVAAVAVLFGAAGCSSGGSATSAASSAVSAAQSEVSALASAASGLASSASSAVASAASEASSALANVKGGLDAKGDVALGTVVTGSDGRADVPVTVTNHASQGYQYTVQVNFDDPSGNLLDTVVISVPEVAAGGTAQATASSHRKLAGTVTAAVGNALRY